MQRQPLERVSKRRRRYSCRLRRIVLDASWSAADFGSSNRLKAQKLGYARRFHSHCIAARNGQSQVYCTTEFRTMFPMPSSLVQRKRSVVIAMK
ncbi:hypothetical protein PHSY_007267 [Pseudozyma hubeiensis SY62]|uniref:Uncharacterized protein n=1 Tax=Pseudozyma hubeiensis (strain SY62) TaxID=1305764 RepID=R9PE70_PSEHS|nr:hypothetical protein PHSY_007267 [Pseudozyma hubeiensis SY62]GAC99664.1 hypothetical protein PHSY_007267 [Pseudozyma hubeiensis SY62]